MILIILFVVLGAIFGFLGYFVTCLSAGSCNTPERKTAAFGILSGILVGAILAFTVCVIIEACVVSGTGELTKWDDHVKDVNSIIWERDDFTRRSVVTLQTDDNVEHSYTQCGVNKIFIEYNEEIPDDEVYVVTVRSHPLKGNWIFAFGQDVSMTGTSVTYVCCNPNMKVSIPVKGIGYPEFAPLTAPSTK